MFKNLIVVYCCILSFSLFADYFDFGVSEENLCPKFYIGGEFGPGWGLSTQKGSHHAGAFFNANTKYGKIHSNSILGCSAGYKLNPLFRADISYFFLRSGFTWKAFFPGNIPSIFQSTLNSHLIFVSSFSYCT